MVEKEGSRKNKIIIFLAIFFIILLSSAAYLLFFYTKKCKEISCFETALFYCRRAAYTNDAEDVAWFYDIKSKTKTDCIIEVEALQIKKGLKEVSKLEGKKMDCKIPLRTVLMPNEDLTRCHGLLKEEMQDIVIEKMHSYIIENLGKINEELRKPI